MGQADFSLDRLDRRVTSQTGNLKFPTNIREDQWIRLKRTTGFDFNQLGRLTLHFERFCVFVDAIDILFDLQDIS